VFAVRGHSVGPWDRITLTHPRWSTRIRNAVDHEGNEQMVALWDPSPREYAPKARLLKFPSGELPARSFLDSDPRVHFDAAAFDELTFFSAPKDPELRNNDDRCMVIKVGDELIGHPDVRGYLNSPEQPHAPGEYVFPLPFLPVSSLSRSMDASQPIVPLAEGLAAGREGYVLIDNEVAYFTRRRGRDLDMPTRLRSSDGLYRGMFGTTAESHSEGALVYAIPFRYFDAFRPGEFDDAMPFFQAATSIPNAHWHDITWEEEAAPLTAVRASVRIDGKKPVWDADVVGRGKIGRHSTKATWALVEVRLNFEYKAGAFFPNDAWKSTPRFRSISLTYDRPWSVLFHSER
jgi:hypothetical protein